PAKPLSKNNTLLIATWYKSANEKDDFCKFLINKLTIIFSEHYKIAFSPTVLSRQSNLPLGNFF
ncbi:MAG TPA: hypothetical protein P5556_06900, partial [Candidatus Gastranaerophilales bacterium]|nr:hypothetical protein [Candidatus Gastranaerophilales bacterium]